MGTERTILVTGFEPFGGEAVNSSAQLATRLGGRTIAGRAVRSAVLPCVFGASVSRLVGLIAEHDPELVVCLGQAGGRRALSFERVAINIADARIPDNSGRRPIDRPVVEGGPVGYWTDLPIKMVVSSLQSSAIPAEVSQTAGTFVCNHTFYGLMHHLARRPDVRGGFVHVPYLPDQAAAWQRPGEPLPPSLPLDTCLKGLHLALLVSVTNRRDMRLAAGALH